MGLLYCIIYLAVLGIASQVIGMNLPRRYFDPNGALYRPWRAEKGGRAYEKLGIRRWKGKLPDMSKFVKSMMPKSVRSRFDAETALLMAKETCVAELVHLVLAVCGFPCVFLWRGWGFLAWGLYALGNLPFIMVQRYNRPRYMAVLNRCADKK